MWCRFWQNLSKHLQCHDMTSYCPCIQFRSNLLDNHIKLVSAIARCASVGCTMDVLVTAWVNTTLLLVFHGYLHHFFHFPFCSFCLFLLPYFHFFSFVIPIILSSFAMTLRYAWNFVLALDSTLSVHSGCDDPRNKAAKSKGALITKTILCSGVADWAAMKHNSKCADRFDIHRFNALFSDGCSAIMFEHRFVKCSNDIASCKRRWILVQSWFSGYVHPDGFFKYTIYPIRRREQLCALDWCPARSCWRGKFIDALERLLSRPTVRRILLDFRRLFLVSGTIL